MAELNSRLAADPWNKLYPEALDDYRDTFEARIKDLRQSGYFVGQLPFRNHQEEAQTMVPLIPALIAITQLPYDIEIEPRKQRAQQMLRRYEEITNAEPTAQSQEG